MGAGTDHALWLRAQLIGARKARRWSLARAAKAIARELGKETMSKQALQQWEAFETHPRIDQFAAWARALGLRLDVDLIDPEDERVEVRIPPDMLEIVRRLEVLDPSDRELLLPVLGRLTRDRD